MCMLDISGAWLDLWRFISLFVGKDTGKRVFFEAGLAEVFFRAALKKRILSIKSCDRNYNKEFACITVLGVYSTGLMRYYRREK